MWLLPAMTVVIVVAGIAINSRIAGQTSDALHRLEKVQYPAVESIRSLHTSVERIQETLQQSVAEGDKEGLTRADQQASAARKELSTLRSLLSSTDELSQSFDQYYAAANQATRILLSVEKGDATDALPRMQSASEKLNRLLTATEENARADLQTLIDNGASNVQRTLTVSIVSAIVMVLALGVGSWILIRSVLSHLGGEPEDAVAVARKIASGDFTTVVPVTGTDRHSLLFSIKQLRDQLAELISNVHHSSRSVDHAASAINSAIEKLSDRTRQQATSLEETAASMEQMTATVRNNADNAHNATTLATNARKQAETGGTVVGRAIDAMTQIRGSSDKIAKIIGVIDAIAFQTNLLALNAAVEAARAGEQGRGFAVVATEVRNLAQRSASAAREIKDLIADSTAKVQDGTSLVDESGKHLSDIVGSVKKMADIVEQIASASNEQARGIEQVNTTVTQLDHVTQGNSAMSDEAMSVAESMSKEARRLLELIAVFKVDQQSQRTTSLESSMESGNSGTQAYAQRYAA
jgi:methyl-accepting chemotaxis protein